MVLTRAVSLISDDFMTRIADILGTAPQTSLQFGFANAFRQHVFQAAGAAPGELQLWTTPFVQAVMQHLIPTWGHATAAGTPSHFRQASRERAPPPPCVRRRAPPAVAAPLACYCRPRSSRRRPTCSSWQPSSSTCR